MKPILTDDPLDALMAAALHGELSPEERTQFDSRLENDPAAQAAYQEARFMHELLEKTNHSAQPDPAFEQRMVSGVRRKIADGEREHETAWESVLVLWRGLKKFRLPVRKASSPLMDILAVLFILAVLAGVALGPITAGIKQSPESRRAMEARQAELDRLASTSQATLSDANAYSGRTVVSGGIIQAGKIMMPQRSLSYLPFAGENEESKKKMPSGWQTQRAASIAQMESPDNSLKEGFEHGTRQFAAKDALSGAVADAAAAMPATPAIPTMLAPTAAPSQVAVNSPTAAPPDAPTVTTANGLQKSVDTVTDSAAPTPQPAAASEDPSRKLIRNAQLDLEVKSFQAAMDQITALTKAAGGYVDTSNSQKGGNGKLQGEVVVKVLPQNLDGFLLKLRGLGEVANQSVGTEDVTKDYYDTQARLVNSQKMEEQLQDLLKRTNGKVAELLQVERELGRVRGDIEQMQGQLKLYDFQTQYATVTIQMHEKDLNQTAAYVLREQDNFSLFATDVEATFQKARAAADDFKAQVLQADLNHNSGSDVSAELVVMVGPEQIESFLGQIRSLGRVANFTRQTQRVAKDGGDSSQPADQTLTEKDKVQVHLSIRSDDETRKQVALTVVTSSVDTALEAAKTAALAQAGTSILGSSLNKSPEGASTAQLSVRVPGSAYAALMQALQGLGRTASLSIQRNDDSGPGANGDDAPVIVSLSLTDDETPLQQTVLSIVAPDVDAQAQQLKRSAAAAGAEVKDSNYARQPDGTETAQLVFRLPMGKYPAFVESLKKEGKVESLTVQRQDRPDQARTDDSAPAEIDLTLHNQPDLVPENDGLWATLRQTFGEGMGALFASIKMIGILVAFAVPWVLALGFFAWVARRIYLWRKGRK